MPSVIFIVHYCNRETRISSVVIVVLKQGNRDAWQKWLLHCRNLSQSSLWIAMPMLCMTIATSAWLTWQKWLLHCRNLSQSSLLIAMSMMCMTIATSAWLTWQKWLLHCRNLSQSYLFMAMSMLCMTIATSAWLTFTWQKWLLHCRNLSQSSLLIAMSMLCMTIATSAWLTWQKWLLHCRNFSRSSLLIAMSILLPMHDSPGRSDCCTVGTCPRALYWWPCPCCVWRRSTGSLQPLHTILFVCYIYYIDIKLWKI